MYYQGEYCLFYMFWKFLIGLKIRTMKSPWTGQCRNLSLAFQGWGTRSPPSKIKYTESAECCPFLGLTLQTNQYKLLLSWWLPYRSHVVSLQNVKKKAATCLNTKIPTFGNKPWKRRIPIQQKNPSMNQSKQKHTKTVWVSCFSFLVSTSVLQQHQNNQQNLVDWRPGGIELAQQKFNRASKTTTRKTKFGAKPKNPLKQPATGKTQQSITVMTGINCNTMSMTSAKDNYNNTQTMSISTK